MMGQDGTDRHREEGRGEVAVQHHMTGEFGGQWLGRRALTDLPHLRDRHYWTQHLHQADLCCQPFPGGREERLGEEREGGREGGKEEGREGREGRKGGKEGERKGEREEGGREGGREVRRQTVRQTHRPAGTEDQVQRSRWSPAHCVVS